MLSTPQKGFDSLLWFYSGTLENCTPTYPMEIIFNLNEMVQNRVHNLLSLPLSNLQCFLRSFLLSERKQSLHRGPSHKHGRHLGPLPLLHFLNHLSQVLSILPDIHHPHRHFSWHHSSRLSGSYLESLWIALTGPWVVFLLKFSLYCTLPFHSALRIVFLKQTWLHWSAI